MDNIVFDAYSKYFNVIEKTGYLADQHLYKLLVLSFYKDFILYDYRGLLSKSDYHLIESALDCLWGSSCLIPYPDYLKMGKLKLGEMTEVLDRVKKVENTKVVKGKDHIQDIRDIDLSGIDVFPDE